MENPIHHFKNLNYEIKKSNAESEESIAGLEDFDDDSDAADFNAHADLSFSQSEIRHDAAQGFYNIDKNSSE